MTQRGTFLLTSAPIDLPGILGELGAAPPAWSGIDPATVMGHVHLQVANVAAAQRFYTDVLGMDVMAHMPSASFVSAGGYHHHLGLNSWAGVGAPAPPSTAARLVSYELLLPTAAALESVRQQVEAARLPLAEHADGWLVHDPSHNPVVLRVAPPVGA